MPGPSITAPGLADPVRDQNRAFIGPLSVVTAAMLASAWSDSEANLNAFPGTTPARTARCV